MKKEVIILILVAILWLLLRIVEFHIGVFVIFTRLWILGMFLTITLVQFIILLEERKNIKKIRVVKVLFYGLFFYLTLLGGFSIDRRIEKANWQILYNKRVEIVEKVKNRELVPNVDRHSDYSFIELPFRFPIVSDGGNEIKIERNDSTQAITVWFFIHWGLLDSPSSFFMYTNDDKRIKYFDSIVERSKSSWKIKENWYRITRRPCGRVL